MRVRAGARRPMGQTRGASGADAGDVPTPMGGRTSPHALVARSSARPQWSTAVCQALALGSACASRIRAAVQRRPWGDRCTACESGAARPCGRRQTGRRGDYGMLSNRALEPRSISASRRTTVKGMPYGISEVPAAYRPANASSNHRTPRTRRRSRGHQVRASLTRRAQAAVKARSTAETRCRSGSDEALTAACTGATIPTLMAALHHR